MHLNSWCCLVGQTISSLTPHFSTHLRAYLLQVYCSLVSSVSARGVKTISGSSCS